VNSKKNVILSIDEALQVLRALEEVVVSLDRLGSSSRDEGEISARMLRYFGEGGAWRRLSHARKVLTEALDREVSEEEVDRLIGDIPYWNGKQY
jgi:hypothetical protein